MADRQYVTGLEGMTGTDPLWFDHDGYMADVEPEEEIGCITWWQYVESGDGDGLDIEVLCQQHGFVSLLDCRRRTTDHERLAEDMARHHANKQASKRRRREKKAYQPGSPQAKGQPAQSAPKVNWGSIPLGQTVRDYEKQMLAAGKDPLNP